MMVFIVNKVKKRETDTHTLTFLGASKTMVNVVFVSRVGVVVLLVTLLVAKQQRGAADAFAPPRPVRLRADQKNVKNKRAAGQGGGGTFHHRRIVAKTPSSASTSSSTSSLQSMKRPLLDQIATALFKLETARVDASSEVDDQGRVGEPMAWSRNDSWANQFSEFMAKYAYGFKQFVADLVAGSDYDKDVVNAEIDAFIQDNAVAMFSFSTCPFCRRAKDALEERGIAYKAMELDELPADRDSDNGTTNVNNNMGNIIRAELGRKTKRTSVPSIFVKGRYIGGCNDGCPGLLSLMESGELEVLLSQ
jgi:glutaredoxin 3